MMLSNWIHPPTFEDNQLTYVARIVHAALSWLMILAPVYVVLSPLLVPGSGPRVLFIFAALMSANFGCLIVNRSNPRLAGALALLVLWFVVTGAVGTSGGTRAVAMFGYFVLLAVCALVFPVRVTLAVMGGVVVTLMAMAWLEVNGLLPERRIIHTPFSAAAAWSFGFAVTVAMVHTASKAVQDYIGRMGEELTARRIAETRLQEANTALDNTVTKLNARMELLEFVHRSAELASWAWNIDTGELEWFGNLVGLLGPVAAEQAWTFGGYRSHLHPDDQAPNRSRIHDGLKGLSPHYRAEERLLLEDGSARRLEAVGFFEYGADGRAVRMAGVLRDITVQHHAQEVVAASERRYRGLFNSALDGIFILSPHGTLIDVNPACCEATGYTRDELIGRAFTDLFPQEELRNDPMRWGMPAQPDSLMTERRLERKDGRLMPVEINRGRLPDGNVQAIVRDTSERQRAEERFAKIFQLGPSVTTISRISDGAYVDMNSVWHEISGYTREEAIGRTSTELGIWVDAGDRGRMLNAIRESGTVHDFAMQARRKSGEIIDLILAAGVLELDGEDYLVNSAVDVTERRRAEAEIVRLNASLEERVRERTLDLQEANRDLESFSYSISHDLRAPLRRILSFAQILRNSNGADLPDDARHMLVRIDDNARRMSELIDDILALSKIGKGQLQNRRLVDMRAEVAGLVEELDLGGVVELGELPSVEGDPSLLRQAWQNLILNAVKFSRNVSAPKVRIRGARLADGSVEYAVEDNGVGFDMKHAGKLFGVFQRLHPESEFEGTGVGLAIVHRIIGRHGGSVAAAGTPGKGAIFTFTLPDAGGKVS